MTSETPTAPVGRPVKLIHPQGREHLADRLLTASAKHSLDPLTEIDWTTPVDPDLFALPPHRCTLYGTDLWNGLSRREQAALSVHEFASTAAAGIWAELVLMQGLIRHVYKSDPRTHHAQYALTEVADECRHSVMFARSITKLGYPQARVQPWERRFGTLLNLTDSTTLILAAGLFVEEFLDTLQREVARDETLLPLTRSVSRIHVIEEARHIGYARDELGRRCATMGTARRASLAQALALCANVFVSAQINPRVYRLSGLPTHTARRTARANPHWHQTRTDWSAKAVTTFTDLGLINRTSKLLWLRAHLMP